MPASASRVSSSSGALAARPPGAVTRGDYIYLSGRLPRAPSFRRLFRRRPSSRRGEALWERVEAGSDSLGAASSESAAGSGRLHLQACGCCRVLGRGFGVIGRRADVRVRVV
jgi:hypothetical protein